MSKKIVIQDKSKWKKSSLVVINYLEVKIFIFYFFIFYMHTQAALLIVLTTKPQMMSMIWAHNPLSS